MRVKHPGTAVTLIITLAGGSVLGCQGTSTEEIDEPWTPVRETQGDTVVVRTVRGSIWRDTMTLVPEVSIGALDGDEEYLLGAVAGLDVDADGRIYVVDRQAQNVRVFSADGEHLLTIGRGGEGPGEFHQPDQVRVTDDNRIVVRDAPWRFSVISKEGEYLLETIVYSEATSSISASGQGRAPWKSGASVTTQFPRESLPKRCVKR